MIVDRYHPGIEPRRGGIIRVGHVIPSGFVACSSTILESSHPFGIGICLPTARNLTHP